MGFQVLRVEIPVWDEALAKDYDAVTEAAINTWSISLGSPGLWSADDDETPTHYQWGHYKLDDFDSVEEFAELIAAVTAGETVPPSETEEGLRAAKVRARKAMRRAEGKEDRIEERKARKAERRKLAVTMHRQAKRQAERKGETLEYGEPFLEDDEATDWWEKAAANELGHSGVTLQ